MRKFFKPATNLLSAKGRIAVLVLGLVLLSTFTQVHRASAGWGFEDPQLCVNGRLLTVVPGSPADVYVSVPPGASVDFDVAHCGGSDEPVRADHVVFTGNDNNMEVAAMNASGPVSFTYNGLTQTKQAGNGVAKAKFKLP